MFFPCANERERDEEDCDELLFQNSTEARTPHETIPGNVIGCNYQYSLQLTCKINYSMCIKCNINLLFRFESNLHLLKFYIWTTGEMSVKYFEISRSNAVKFMTQENTIQVGWMWIFDICYSQYAISVDLVCSTFYHLVVGRLHIIDLLTAKIKTAGSSGAACLRNWKVNL